MNNELHNDELMIDYSRVQSVMLSIKSDAMDCRVAWCRFKTARTESLERPRHKHIVYEIHYVLDGKLNHSFSDFDNITTEKGHFVLIPSGALHSTSSIDSKTEYLVAAFSVSSDNEAVNMVFSEGNAPFSAAITTAMSGMIEALKAKAFEEDFVDSFSTKLIIHSIILETVDAIIESRGLRHLYRIGSANTDSRVSSIERIVDENKYGQKLRGEDVARRLNLTTRQLNRICNEQFGCSINNYITKVRMDSMKQLLEQSNYTLMDISAIFGFGDVCTFTKHFTKYAGISPGKYRVRADSITDTSKAELS